MKKEIDVMRHFSMRKGVSTTYKPINIGELYKEISTLSIPSYQRPIVWREQDIAEFGTSILNKYPIPPIIISKREGKNYIVDGQQRCFAVSRLVEDDVYWVSKSDLLNLNIKVYYRKRKESNAISFKELWNSVLSFNSQYFVDRLQIDSGLAQQFLMGLLGTLQDRFLSFMEIQFSNQEQEWEYFYSLNSTGIQLNDADRFSFRYLQTAEGHLFPRKNEEFLLSNACEGVLKNIQKNIGRRGDYRNHFLEIFSHIVKMDGNDSYTISDVFRDTNTSLLDPVKLQSAWEKYGEKFNMVFEMLDRKKYYNRSISTCLADYLTALMCVFVEEGTPKMSLFLESIEIFKSYKKRPTVTKTDVRLFLFFLKIAKSGDFMGSRSVDGEFSIHVPVENEAVQKYLEQEYSLLMQKYSTNSYINNLQSTNETVEKTVTVQTE